jgi:hypothetical protein
MPQLSFHHLPLPKYYHYDVSQQNSDCQNENKRAGNMNLKSNGFHFLLLEDRKKPIIAETMRVPKC